AASARTVAPREPARAARETAGRRPRPLPLPAIAAALTLAAIGAAPRLIDLFSDLPGTAASFTLAVPVVTRSIVIVLRSPEGGFGGLVTVVSWVAATTLVIIGLFVARAAPGKRRKAGSVEGGM